MGVDTSCRFQSAFFGSSSRQCGTMETAKAIAILRGIYDTDAVPAPSRDNDYEPLWGPVVICGAISCDTFLYLLEHDEDVERLRWIFEPYGCAGMGRVVMHSVSTPVHECITKAIVQSIRDQLIALGDDTSLQQALRQPASLVCHFQSQLQAPDDALVPAEAPKGSLPTLVIEVAYLNETMAALRARLARWIMSTAGVHVAIGVKVFEKARRSLVLMQRGGNTQVTEFGSRGGATPAISSVAFPVQALFQGFSLPSTLVGHERELIELDIDRLRVVIQRAQRLMKRRGSGGHGW